MNDRPWILADYADALDQLGKALERPSEDDLVRAGTIQYFEFCFELAWKSIKIIGTAAGLEDCLSPRACLRLAFAQQWIHNEAIWLEMLDARNRMAHTYSAKKALEIYTRLADYHDELRTLSAALNNA